MKVRERKRIARRKRIKKATNTSRNNRSSIKYRIDVNISGNWVSIGGLRNISVVREYVANQSEIRKDGKTDMLESIITEVKTGKVVAHMQAYSAPDNSEGLDKIEDINEASFPAIDVGVE